MFLDLLAGDLIEYSTAFLGQTAVALQAQPLFTPGENRRPGTTLHLQVEHCMSGYAIGCLGTTLHVRVRYCMFGYDIAPYRTGYDIKLSTTRQYGTI